MDEKAKETALKYMANLVEKTPPPTKFAISLPESREVTEGMLLGMYGAQVKYRDMDFILDDATVSKVEKVVRWMYDSRKRGLLLCGTLGNGKTTMLRSLKKLFGFNAEYYEAQSIYNHFKQSQTFPDISQNTFLLIFLSVPVLHLLHNPAFAAAGSKAFFLSDKKSCTKKLRSGQI